MKAECPRDYKSFFYFAEKHRFQSRQKGSCVFFKTDLIGLNGTGTSTLIQLRWEMAFRKSSWDFFSLIRSLDKPTWFLFLAAEKVSPSATTRQVRTAMENQNFEQKPLPSLWPLLWVAFDITNQNVSKALLPTNSTRILCHSTKNGLFSTTRRLQNMQERICLKVVVVSPLLSAQAAVNFFRHAFPFTISVSHLNCTF